MAAMASRSAGPLAPSERIHGAQQVDGLRGCHDEAATAEGPDELVEEAGERTAVGHASPSGVRDSLSEQGLDKGLHPRVLVGTGSDEDVAHDAALVDDEERGQRGDSVRLARRGVRIAGHGIAQVEVVLVDRRGLDRSVVIPTTFSPSAP